MKTILFLSFTFLLAITACKKEDDNSKNEDKGAADLYFWHLDVNGTIDSTVAIGITSANSNLHHTTSGTNISRQDNGPCASNSFHNTYHKSVDAEVEYTIDVVYHKPSDGSDFTTTITLEKDECFEVSI